MAETALKGKTFLNYIHYFRGLAIVFIVAVHSVISLPWDNEKLRKAILTISSNGTVLFVFISGFLFYYLCHKKFNYKTYLIKKAQYVILPYLIVSIPAILDKLFLDNGNHWWMTPSFDQLSTFSKIVYMLGTGRHSGILWFIPMITIFYFLSYPLLQFAKTKAFDYLIPIICILGFFTVQFGYKSDALTSLVHFMPIYLIGMWTCKFKEKFFTISTPLLTTTSVVYVIMSILELEEIIPFDRYLELRDSAEQFFVFNLSKIKALDLCFVLLLLFKIYENRQWLIFTKLGDFSFGIFFLHLYLINAFQFLFNKGLLPITSLNIFTYVLYVVTIISICMIIIATVQKVMGKNSRMVLGS